MVRKGTPKHDGSGGGTRNNKGRGGCAIPRKSGQGQKSRPVRRTRNKK